jgi:hypothetical protein
LEAIDTTRGYVMQQGSKERHTVSIGRKEDLEHIAIRDKIIAVKMSELRQFKQQPEKHVIAMAGGKSTRHAITYALEDPYFNVLVIDEDIAEFLVEQISGCKQEFLALHSNAPRRQAIGDTPR